MMFVLKTKHVVLRLFVSLGFVYCIHFSIPLEPYILLIMARNDPNLSLVAQFVFFQQLFGEPNTRIDYLHFVCRTFVHIKHAHIIATVYALRMSIIKITHFFNVAGVIIIFQNEK